MPEPVSTTVAPLAAFEAIKKVDDALGVLTKLVDTLTANPGVAAAKLAEVLGEIRKTCVVVDDAVVAYLNLALEKDALAKGSKMLLDISNGKLEAKVEEGRGRIYARSRDPASCHTKLSLQTRVGPYMREIERLREIERSQFCPPDAKGLTEDYPIFALSGPCWCILCLPPSHGGASTYGTNIAADEISRWSIDLSGAT
jgi:hypothetical protein